MADLKFPSNIATTNPNTAAGNSIEVQGVLNGLTAAITTAVKSVQVNTQTTTVVSNSTKPSENLNSLKSEQAAENKKKEVHEETLLTKSINSIKTSMNTVGKHIDKATGVVGDEVSESVRSGLGGGLFAKSINSLTTFFTTKFGTYFNKILSPILALPHALVKGVWNLMKGGFNLLIKGVWNLMAYTFKSMFSALKSIGRGLKSLGGFIINGIGKSLKGIGSWIMGILPIIGSFLFSGLKGVGGLLGLLLKPAAGLLLNILKPIGGFLLSAFGPLKNLLFGIVKFAFNPLAIASYLGVALGSWISTKIFGTEKVKEFWNAIVNKPLETMKIIFNEWGIQLKELFGKIMDWLNPKEMLNKGWNATKDFFGFGPEKTEVVFNPATMSVAPGISTLDTTKYFTKELATNKINYDNTKTSSGSTIITNSMPTATTINNSSQSVSIPSNLNTYNNEISFNKNSMSLAY